VHLKSKYYILWQWIKSILTLDDVDSTNSKELVDLTQKIGLNFQLDMEMILSMKELQFWAMVFNWVLKDCNEA
jgi:hypothetical protein